MAASIGRLLYPSHESSLTAVIRYEKDRARLRAWAGVQRRHDALRKKRARTWAARVAAQGPWDPAVKPISLRGVPAVPMPVKVAREHELAPLLRHLRGRGGCEAHEGSGARELEDGRGEPGYGVRGAEFPRGVLYEDGRMDLCKMVVGPDHIGALMDSLRGNTFVRHFLLGNNIVGPRGAREIAAFAAEFPGRMQTWYLAGNCIDAGSFRALIDAWAAPAGAAVTDVWMKRNPLGAEAAGDAARLIARTGVQTLDLDQTELGDAGVAALFEDLLRAETREPGKEEEECRFPLRQVYLNGNGISEAGARAVGRFLGSPRCGITSVYMSNNPLGNAGAAALAEGLSATPGLQRLLLESAGIGTRGAVALLEALPRGTIRSLSLGQSYATEDLGQAYNWVGDEAVDALAALLRESRLEYLSLGLCALSPAGLVRLAPSILASSSLLYFRAEFLPARAAATATAGQDKGKGQGKGKGQPKATSCSVEAGARLQELARCERAIREHLEGNVRARYGAKGGATTMSYREFMDEEKRWLVNDGAVRRIDSVYRNRDAGMARRGAMTLVKHWEEGDDSLERVMRGVTGLAV
ncbi:Protein NLRC3 [Escovopsis weberi]|uniref:Protein NLRC3 n=1 Tax=Escovopsis weberi TaxID=150374 RepID=A0A0M8N0S7_ESCWE|nr:Protein NLRC3 [Escovopsis weberi]